ncbi:MAG: O-antigen ligase family protein [Elusimicrobiales bacterium]|jgi:O-antigen ligase
MEILLLGSVVFAPLAFASVEPWAFGLLYAVFFGMAAYIFVTGRGRAANPLYKNLLPAVLCVAAIGLLQALTENPVSAHPSPLFTAWRPATLNAVVTWLFYASVLYCVPQIITTPRRLKRLLWVIFATGVFIALLGMLQKTGDNTLVYGLRRVQGEEPFGPFVNRDHAATFLLMSVMSGLGLFVSGFGALRRGQGRAPFFDVLAAQLLKLVMICAAVCGLIRTDSRGGLHSFALVSAAAGFICAGSLKARKLRMGVYAGLILLAAVYGVFVSQNKKLLGLKNGYFDTSVVMRFSMYKSGFDMFGDFPVFGVGLGAVEYAFPYYRLPGIPEDRLVRHVHSDWLELFLQTGLAGGLLYLAGFLAALYFFFKTWSRARSFTLKALCGGALGAIAAVSAHNLTEFGTQMPANALVFYILLGALASKPAVEGRPRHDPACEEPPQRSPAPLPYAVTAAVLAVLLSAWTLPQFIAWRYDRLAKDAPFDRKIKFRAASLKWAPGPQAAFRLGADYYNQGLIDKTAPCALFRDSRQVIEPYLRRAAVNYDLNRLKGFLLLQLENCSASAG